jgi:pyroglutamyl-peptidase
LAHLYKQNRPRKVLFLHVPAVATEEFVKSGTEYATQLIRSMVESEVEKKQTAKS